jgi:hypothetical protein
MKGKQKVVYDGLLYLARKVFDGAYGVDDECCNENITSEALREDLQTEVFDNIE